MIRFILVVVLLGPFCVVVYDVISVCGTGNGRIPRTSLSVTKDGASSPPTT